MRYEFKPNKKKSGRNQYVGKWEETKCKLIPLPFTIESLRTILNWGEHHENSEYTHQQIAHWCDLMHMKYIDTDESPDFDRALSIAADVDCQWDLYLANTYQLKELQELDFSKVKLPIEWFADWLEQLEGTEQPL